MKLIRSVLFITIIFVAACVKDPGPIPPDMSRIKVQCTGFSMGYSHIISVNIAATNQEVGEQKLGCLLYDAVYFDVPVPPSAYDVKADSKIIETVTFSGPGEQKTVRINVFFIVTTQMVWNY